MDSNFFRGFVFAQAAFVFLITLAIVIRYATKLALTKQEDRARPWHILLIGGSYLWATILICMVVRERWGGPMTYVGYNAAGIFLLGDAALLFMLSHLLVQRKMMGEIYEYAAREAIEEKRELAAELKKQTSGLAQMIKNSGMKADDAYHEANEVNIKIAGFNKEVSGKLSEIKDNAETARIKAVEAVAKADEIEETGKDTNVRVRRIEPKNQT